MSNNGSDTTANALMTSLLSGVAFEIPEVDFEDNAYKLPNEADSDLYKSVTRLTNTDLTTGVADGNGTGTFDAIMNAFNAHLQKEYESDRISGAEYAKVYIALAEQAM